MKQKTKNIIALAGISTFTIHFINHIQYSLNTVKNVLSCSDNNYFEWRFGKIRYTKKGSGTPVLLIHNLIQGSSNYEFHYLTESLSKKYEVYSIDLLGYGLSDKPDMTYTNYVYVQLIIDFIKSIIGKKTNIITCGDSAPVVIMACHNDPEVIDKMILINPQSLYKANQIPSKQTKALKLLIESPVIGTFIYNLLNNKNAYENLFKTEYFYNQIKINEKDILSYLEAAHTPNYHSKHVFASYVGRYMNANIIHALKEINHSIYIIAGEEIKDIQTTVENYIYYNTAIESVYIPKTKLLPHLENPEETLKQCETFLIS